MADEVLELRHELREAIKKFSQSMEDVKEILHEHSVLIAKLVERDEEHKRNIERFWTSDWQRMESRCAVHQMNTATTEKTLIALQAEVSQCVRTLSATVATVQQIQEARWKMAGALGLIAFIAGVAGSMLAG